MDTRSRDIIDEVTARDRRPDEEPRYYGVRLMTRCRHCGMPLPLCGLLLQVPCNHCMETNHLPEELWGQVIRVVDGSQRQRIKHGRFEVELESSVAPPPDEDLMEDAFDAPDWLRAQVQTVRRFFGAGCEGRTGAGLAVDQAAERPVAFSCPKCSASLEITADSPRTSTCEYCKTDVYLPDGLWLRLHPVQKATQFYVEYRGESEEARERRLESHRQREAQRNEQLRQLANQRRDLLQQRDKIEMPTFNSVIIGTLVCSLLFGATAYAGCGHNRAGLVAALLFLPVFAVLFGVKYLGERRRRQRLRAAIDARLERIDIEHAE